MALLEHPGWILLILCVLGIVLAMISVIPVIRSGLTVSRHLKSVKDAPLFRAAEPLQSALARLQSSAEQAKLLAARAQAVVASMQQDVRRSGIIQIIGGIRTASLAIRLIVHELR